ncbi:methyltransferase domain-containing protein [bacterium]|nr:methyltransferase domain-containing protein [bacterium]
MKKYKFSIITPTHSIKNIPFLVELYQSIVSQTYTNWEWILYLNGEIKLDNLPKPILQNKKIKKYYYDGDNTNVGFLKNLAFNTGEGDILVEADHDDILTDNCLEKLNIAYQDQEAGFVFSDNATYHMQDKFTPYNELWGWTHKLYNHNGKNLFAMNSFEPSSHSVGYIWYAPDHVRSWRASVYKELGGHNPELSICDDHELMIRTYLKTKFVRIPEVLYIYRVTGENTWLERNKDIQITTVKLFNQYAQQLAERDADKNKLLKVDLGGGINKRKGYVSIDLHDADIEFNLNQGIPLPDNSVGVINASHVIEHLHDKTYTMKEIHRVLAHGGWAFIEVPSTDGRGAFQDPTHVSYWNENSFLYYTNSYLANFIRNKDIRFQEFRRETWFPNEWLKKMNVCVTTWWGVAVKEGGRRLPHRLEI